MASNDESMNSTINDDQPNPKLNNNIIICNSPSPSPPRIRNKETLQFENEVVQAKKEEIAIQMKKNLIQRKNDELEKAEDNIVTTQKTYQQLSDKAKQANINFKASIDKRDKIRNEIYDLNKNLGKLQENLKFKHKRLKTRSYSTSIDYKLDAKMNLLSFNKSKLQKIDLEEDE